MQTTWTTPRAQRFTARRAHAGCLCCYAFWSALAVIAYFWPALLIWIGGGIVVALVIGALANPIPEIHVGPKDVHDPRRVLR